MKGPEAHSAGPVCLVTGGNRGLGLATCRLLAVRQARVILTSRDARLGAEAAETLRREGLFVDAQRLDVTEQSGPETIRAYAERSYGRLDVLINNAGRGVPGDGSILSTGPEQFGPTLATNCFAPLQLSQVLLPLLRGGKPGRIINVSSGAGSLSWAGKGNAAYRLSKACLNAITTLLAAELSDGSVVINAVCPGSVRTRMGGPDAQRDPEEAAEAVVWLALDAPPDLNGKFLRDRRVIPW